MGIEPAIGRRWQGPGLVKAMGSAPAFTWRERDIPLLAPQKLTGPDGR